MESERLVTLRTKDGVEYIIPEAVAKQAMVLRYMMEEDDCSTEGIIIPLDNVSSKILPKVIEYCMHQVHRESSEVSDAEQCAWEERFVETDLEILYEVMLAANYLDIRGLLDLACKKVARMIMGKPVEVIRETFGITNDFTPEEEEEIRAENLWVSE